MIDDERSASVVLSQIVMSEEAERLKERTMRFAINYRASCRARSHAEFTAKIGLVAEEADESQSWLEFIEAGRLIRSSALTRLVGESCELVAIFSASVGTARRNQRNRRS
jgi:four helix bundle protein